MDEDDKTQPPADNLSAEALEQTMEEVVETLALTQRAAAVFQKRNPTPRERERSENVRQTAEAMLYAAAEHNSGRQQRQDESLDDPRIVH
jgi:hypothetical protein